MKLITFRGKAQSLPAWSRELQIPENTLRSRLTKLGMCVEEAFTRPPDSRFRPVPKPTGPPPVALAPKLEQRADGRAACRWTENGRRRERYFGSHGTVEAGTAYAAFVAE